MVILHYIPDTANRQALEFVDTLVARTEKTMDIHIVRGRQTRHQWLQHLYTLSPDIVHVHCCWNFNAAQVNRWSRHRGYDVVLSPHGDLAPKVLEHEFFKYRLPRILGYQLRAVRKAAVMHATSPDEVKHLKLLGWRKRIALVAPDEHIATELYKLYVKVLNTSERNRLHVHQMEALCTLTYVVHTNEHELPVVHPDAMARLRKLSSHDWRAITTFAVYHHLERIVKRGANILMLTIPEQWINLLTTKDIPQFALKYRIKQVETLPQIKKLDRYFPSTPTDDAVTQMSRSIVVDIIRIYEILVNQNSLDTNISSFALAAVVAEKLRWEDYSDELIFKYLDKVSLIPFASSLMQVLSEMQMLTIGFMPIDPKDNYTTDFIKKQINNLI